MPTTHPLHAAGPVVAVCRKPTAEEQAAYESAVKAREQTIPVLNDYLQRLLTLDTALVGGGFLVAKGDVLPYWCGVAVLALLVSSLACAAYGLLPVMGFVRLHAPGGLHAYQKWEDGVILKKNQAMVFGSAILVAALVVGVGGLVAKGKPPEQAATQKG